MKKKKMYFNNLYIIIITYLLDSLANKTQTTDNLFRYQIIAAHLHHFSWWITINQSCDECAGLCGLSVGLRPMRTSILYINRTLGVCVCVINYSPCLYRMFWRINHTNIIIDPFIFVAFSQNCSVSNNCGDFISEKTPAQVQQPLRTVRFRAHGPDDSWVVAGYLHYLVPTFVTTSFSDIYRENNINIISEIKKNYYKLVDDGSFLFSYLAAVFPVPSKYDETNVTIL